MDNTIKHLNNNFHNKIESYNKVLRLEDHERFHKLMKLNNFSKVIEIFKLFLPNKLSK